MLCINCLDEGMRPYCPICYKRKPKKKKKKEGYKVREARIRKTDQEREREKFLKKMWQKLKDFNMKTTGSPETDKTLIEEFGPWWT